MPLADRKKAEETARGNFEVNGCFSYQSQLYDQVERRMRLFAKEVGPEIKNWQQQSGRQPVDVALSSSAAVAT